jgi:hypothetical protein
VDKKIREELTVSGGVLYLERGVKRFEHVVVTLKFGVLYQPSNDGGGAW